MLELNRSYTKPELTRMLGTQSKQGIDRKLQRYGVGFEVCGRGENAAYTIKTMADPFKVYAITELKVDGGTDFTKLRNVYYHFFEDEVFMAMPDEVKEARLHKIGEGVSRQAIAGYIQKLEQRNMITRHTNNFIYYFAFRQEQRIVERAEYTNTGRTGMLASIVIRLFAGCSSGMAESHESKKSRLSTVSTMKKLNTC